MASASLPFPHSWICVCGQVSYFSCAAQLCCAVWGRCWEVASQIVTCIILHWQTAVPTPKVMTRHQLLNKDGGCLWDPTASQIRSRSGSSQHTSGLGTPTGDSVGRKLLATSMTAPLENRNWFPHMNGIELVSLQQGHTSFQGQEFRSSGDKLTSVRTLNSYLQHAALLIESPGAGNEEQLQVQNAVKAPPQHLTRVRCSCAK